MKTQRATREITDATFDEEVLKRRGVVLLDFWAQWCGPCRAFAPVFEEVARRHPDVLFGKVDTDVERGLASAFRIRAIPTLAVVRDGIVVGVQAGMVPGAALERIVEDAKALDMNAVRQKLDEAVAKAADRAKTTTTHEGERA